MNTNRDTGREVLEGLLELKRGRAGRVINVPPVIEIRKKAGLSQSRFATLLGVSVRTLQDWEQGRRVPSGAARTLLHVAHRNPEVLLDVAVISGLYKDRKKRHGEQANVSESPNCHSNLTQ